MNVEKIGSGYINPPSTQRTEPSQDGTKVKPESRPEGSRLDKLSLSKEAREMRAILKAIKELPDLRMDKVADLQRQIDRGVYHVPAEKLARKMLGME